LWTTKVFLDPIDDFSRTVWIKRLVVLVLLVLPGIALIVCRSGTST